MDDAAWMRRALAVAARARGTVSPNPLVGCVLVADGAAVGEGCTQPPGGPHAEIVALRAAGGRARGATAYVTLEPCAHTGRTGPCAEALRAAGVTRVVAALADTNLIAAGGGAELAAAGVAVEVGLLAEQAAFANRVFLHGISHERPWVVLKAAASLDGRIAAADGTSQWLTGPGARRVAHRLRADADAVLVGSGTVLADDPHLTVRLPGYTGPPPLRVVLDGRGRTPEAARVLDEAAPTLLVLRPEAHAQADRLRATAAEVVVASPGDLGAVLGLLAVRGVRSVLVEGGGAVAGSFVRAGLVDELSCHLAPVLLGEAGRPWLVGDGIATLADAPRLRLADSARLGDDTVLTLVRAQTDEPALASAAQAPTAQTE
jgi:diaminohydroxyphosphoribosylaminopyrimidine deaminase/5-amino-6-(5-phosphoribosylamino)uracil reductase